MEIPRTNTTGTDFGFWALGINNFTATTTNPQLRIRYGSESTNYAYTDTLDVEENELTNADYPITKSRALGNGTWYARGYLYDDTGQLLITNNETVFNISDATGTRTFASQVDLNEFSYNLGTASSSLENCQQYSGGFWSSSTLQAISCYTIRTGFNISQFLFVANNSNIDGLKDEIQKFENIFPFSLYFQVLNTTKNSLRSSNVATTTNTSLSIVGLQGNNLTLFTLTSTTLKDALVNATQTTRFGTTPGCNYACADDRIERIFNFISMGIWIYTGITILGMIILI